MRSAIGITWLLVATACAMPSRPEAGSASQDASGAHAQLEDLRALEGDWWGTGVEGTERDRVEFRYRIAEGGSVVEETCFPGTPEEQVTKYRVDGERLVGTRTSASGPPVELVARAGDEVWSCSYSQRGWSRTGKWEDTIWTDSSAREWKKDTNRRGLVFSFATAAQVEPTDVRSQPAYRLEIDVGKEIRATWWTPDNHRKDEAFRSYHLMRKLPGGVERTANRDVPVEKKSRQPENPYWDLRSEP
jgi:hypothetical protein